MVGCSSVGCVGNVLWEGTVEAGVSKGDGDSEVGLEFVRGNDAAPAASEGAAATDEAEDVVATADGCACVTAGDVERGTDASGADRLNDDAASVDVMDVVPASLVPAEVVASKPLSKSRDLRLWNMPKRSKDLFTDGDDVPLCGLLVSPFTSKKRAKRLLCSLSVSSCARS